jgi:regulator of protease activity HflC (stomatin/prohibitin superfamily)
VKLLAAIAGLFVTVWGLIRGLVRAKSAQAVAEKRSDDLESNLEANDAAKIHLDDPPRDLAGRLALARRLRRERAAARLPDS